MMDRRAFLMGTAAAALASKVFAAEGAGILSGPEIPFSFDKLIADAKALSEKPFEKAQVKDRDTLERLDFDEHQQIRFRSDSAIWVKGDGPYPIELFHPGKWFKEPVRIFVVNGTSAREVKYSSDLFSYGTSEFAKTLPPDTGFAGFRVMTAPGVPDWLAFLGASYFRSPAETGQYGLSARGLAIDTALNRPEEFPRFTQFWLEKPADGRKGVIVNALLDSPSITGAYRFDVEHPGRTVMDVRAHLFPRADIERVGIAPLTSMYWYGKPNRKVAVDWRPEIHDSDGLSIWSGGNERIWRPLNNPRSIQTSSFYDTNPKGFGLLQRERNYSQYEDDGAFYNKRPDVWVEPQGDWGEGAVQLVEIPTDDEIHDNIVAYWTPKEPFRRGQHREVGYKLYWSLEEPFPSPLAKVVATRVGAGGIPGRPRPRGLVKYVVDFEGGKLSELRRRGDIDVVITVPTGRVEREAVYPVVDSERWRVMFDYTAASETPVDIRVYLKKGNDALSETWLFQHLASLATL
jgi:glucans biosynthesis protein